MKCFQIFINVNLPIFKKKNLGLRNIFFCPKNVFTLFHIAMHTLYILLMCINLPPLDRTRECHRVCHYLQVEYFVQLAVSFKDLHFIVIQLIEHYNLIVIKISKRKVGNLVLQRQVKYCNYLPKLCIYVDLNLIVHFKKKL